MQVFIGSYALPTNGAEVTSRVEASAYAVDGRPIRYTAHLSVLAWLDGSGQADLAAKEAAIRAALAVPGANLVWKLDDGSTSPTSLLSAATLTGNRVVSGPDFQNEARDGEYVTQRTCRFEISAEYPALLSATALVAWNETVTVTGDGGPDTSWRFPLNARPIRQVVTPFSLVTAVQAGEAVGHTARPDPPPPLWPAYLVRPRSAVSGTSPKLLGRTYVDLGRRWNYVFEADGPLVGNPTPPPLGR